MNVFTALTLIQSNLLFMPNGKATADLTADVIATINEALNQPTKEKMVSVLTGAMK